MLKILYFSGGYQLFQISPGIKSLYYRRRKSIHLLTGEAISANLSTGKATGAHLTGALGHGVCRDLICNAPVYLPKEGINFVSIYCIYIISKGKILESASKMVVTRAIWIGIGIWYAVYQFIYLNKSKLE